ncbi:carbohydrate binding family 9 domain-containing protein [Muriicola soli]|uniref:Hydrolase n=1 Tax=Muriicola soli TaxID=2507538 RepID=A0A411E954_9FLAO|nr:carbohydrate binding family 9 domain-containing protein [Muriicola soli]QBA64168.1 hydrolase [Muriicola soli]
MIKPAHLLAFVLLLADICLGQKQNADYTINIKKTQLPVVVDGVGDDTVWEDADVADNFFMVLPMDKGLASQRSEIRMVYDEDNIYLLATFFNDSLGPNYVESLRRDFSFGKNDNFLLFLDPFNNQTTGFTFGANAAGAQWDGTMFGGSSVDLSWDSKWISAVKRDEEKWVFEMALPFKSIRYEKGVKQWGINFSRLDLKTSEKSSWTPIPRQFPTSSLALSGTLIWDAPPPAPKFNMSLIPYVLGEVRSEADGSRSTEGKIGGDVKLSLTSSLNLDLTVNPDFSQVEVDRQVTNLDRFELFFPERRQFFLENADLFANFGYATVRPFFSRRIGLGVDIDAGARVSGNLNENWRMGLMSIQTASVEDRGRPSQNFGVLSLQKKVFSRSNIGLIFVNKQSFNYPTDQDSLRTEFPEYNRNLGLEYNLASSNNLWSGKAFLLKSFAPDADRQGIAQAANLTYNNRQWSWGLQEEVISTGYSAEVGFVPREDYVRLSGFAGYLFFPSKGPLVSHGPRVDLSHFFDNNFNQTDYQNTIGYSLNYRNRSALNFQFINEYVELLAPFDPTRTGKPELATGEKNRWNTLRLVYNSKPQALFTYSFDSSLGGYYENGTRLNFSNELGYRFQPYVSLSSVLSYNHITLPAPWNTTQFLLIGSKADITFSNTLFWATLFQYNEQTKNFNLNSRLQWRYQPASDLFLVFTQNERLEPFSGSSWSLTLKLTYWFNP